MSFSNLWVWKFNKRNAFKIYRSHGKSGDADALAVQEKLPTIQDAINKYAMNYVWNAEEFALFHEMASVGIVSPG